MNVSMAGKWVLVAAVLCSAAAWAAESATPTTSPERVERKGALAGLPSQPGPTIEKIRALGDNEWLNLGRPAPDPKWGQGRGRAWSFRMAYAPDLRGAFLVGEGPHGFVKPDGRFDDIFFYDLNAHRWICIFPGVNVGTFVEDIKKGELKLNVDGQLVDKDGGIVPLATGHSYLRQIYDTDLRKWVTSCYVSGIGGNMWCAPAAWYKEGYALLNKQGKVDKNPNNFLCFDTVTGVFERPAGKKRGWVSCERSEALFYLPTAKAYWTYSSAWGVRIGDGATCQGMVTKTKGPPGIDFGACYDSKRDRIYMSGGIYRPAYGKDEGYVYIYDVKTNAWSNPPNKENAIELPSSAGGGIHYDSVNDRVVVFRANDYVSAYDPETGAWTEKLPLPGGVRHGCWHGFYSPEVNAHFIFRAGDGSEGVVWAYRYKRAVEKK
ncbi:MAG: hypothetical protein PHU85_14105 [Phycisphaerae bacterium]|nr:hypothetical protein [Phycisphaerae bacterium]